MITAGHKPDEARPRRFYSTGKLSERMSETPEGFLICEGVAIARTGVMAYNPDETPISAGDGPTMVSRSKEDIHSPETIASFEGKPVTIEHPEDFVTPENWKELAVGIVQNVRAGQGDDADKLVADLLITDKNAIQAIRERRLREVSCGYDAEYIEEGKGLGRVKNIIGNHLALVQFGRCGSECAIFDHAPKPTKLMKLKDRILAGFGRTLDEELKKDEEAVEVPATDEEEVPAGDHTPEEMAALEERLTKIEAALAQLLGVMDEEEKPASEDEEAEEMVEDEEEKEAVADEEEDVTITADTASRAEILAPSITKTGDVKAKALKAAYATKDGKSVIDTLLAGRNFGAVTGSEKDMLFIGASEMMKAMRKSKTPRKVTIDNLPSIKAGTMTPEKINEINAAKYGKK